MLPSPLLPPNHILLPFPFFLPRAATMDDILPPLPVFPRPSPPGRWMASRHQRLSPPSARRVRSATSPSPYPPHSPVSTPTRSRQPSAPRMMQESPSAQPPPPPALARTTTALPLVLRLAPMMDELDYLLHFLPPALLPNLLQQLKRIDQAQGKLMQCQEKRVREVRWGRMMS